LVTANRSLSRGEIISFSDVSTNLIELQRFRKEGYSDINQVVGAKVKRVLRPGDVVERGDICVVCRNEKVVIKATKDGMTITTQGTSLQDGATGEQVRVKNDKSQRIIEGIVTGIAEV
ncbi:flagella basal body P-ring formation protein FlgA, partial [Vibrio vulnificus]